MHSDTASPADSGPDPRKIEPIPVFVGIGFLSKEGSPVINA